MGQLETQTLAWKDKCPVILTSLYKVSSLPEKAASVPHIIWALRCVLTSWELDGMPPKMCLSYPFESLPNINGQLNSRPQFAECFHAHFSFNHISSW